MKPNWTVTQRGCSVSRMWKMFAALVLTISTALAQEQISTYNALRIVGVHLNRDAVNGGPVGTINIGANRGNVTRTEGMFAGATMADVQTEREVPPERRHEEGKEEVSEEGDNEHGPLYGVRQRMHGYFQRAQDEASGMFDRVRRS